MKKTKTIKSKIVIIILTLIILILIAIILELMAFISRGKPEFVALSEPSYEIQPGEITAAIENCYWAYIDTSYIIIGTREDGQYYKIVSGVPRNNYEDVNIVSDTDNGYLYYADANQYTSKVAIDVSYFQQYIDWEMVKASGVDVAIVRVGYRGYGTGELAEDEMCREHISGALDAGLEVGVYFYSQAISYEEGAEEANFTLDIISDYNITYPVVFDTEYLGVEESRGDALTVDERTSAALGFLETVANAGYTPMLYSNRNWFVQNLDMSRLVSYRLWLAQYSDLPDFPYWYDAWQYRSDGYVPGVDGEVDINIWYNNDYN